MKLKRLIKELEQLESNGYSNCPVEIVCPNGLCVAPIIKFNMKDKRDIFNHSIENTESLVLTWT